MIKDIWKNIGIPLIATIIFFITLPILNNEIISTVILIACIVITFAIKYVKREWTLFSIGLILGIIIEVGGDAIYKLQYWQTESIIGIPLWLPILWGFQFVIVYRIGSVIMKK